MVYVLALGAALANALTSIFQRMGVEDAPASDTMRIRLLAHALRNRVWLAGFGLMVLSFCMQATALHIGRLSEVQPLLTAELLFLVVILGTWFQFPLGWRDWLGSSAAAVGLAGFLLFAAPGGGNARPSVASWAGVGGACAVAAGTGLLLARRGPRWWRAAMFGVSGAICYAFAAACTKQVSRLAVGDWVSIFWHWETYALAASGALAVFLAQNAYHAGPIAASQSTLVLVDPLTSILIGIALFHDDLRTRGAWGPLEAVSLLVMFAGGLLLSSSPLITGIRASGGREDEHLRPRLRSEEAGRGRHDAMPEPGVQHFGP